MLRTAVLTVVGLAGALVYLTFSSALAQPWAPIWFGQRGAPIPVQVTTNGNGIGDLPVPSVPVLNGNVTDVQRFALARNAGFSATDAITMTAISIAEDGSGNPTALSAPNRDGSRDYCLVQVNSSWWARFGGQQALSDPQTCFNAGHTIFTIQGWCAWSTFERNCGPGHTGSYLNFLERAIVAAQGG